MNSVGASGSNPVGLVFRERRLAAILPALLLVRCTCALALDPTLDISQYSHTSWKVREGFVKGAIFSIAQTPDGYLWLGTEFGLVRFDGVRAVPWLPPTGEHLPSNFISSLLGAHDGALWIGTHRGLARWKEGKLTNYPVVGERNITALIEDHDGTVWIGAFGSKAGSFCAAKGSTVQCYGAGPFGRGVGALYEDKKDNLWIAAETALWRWAPGTPEHYSFPQRGTNAWSLIQDDSGTLLISTFSQGLKQLVGGKIVAYGFPGVAWQFNPGSFLRSMDGSIWMGSLQGLFHLHGGGIDRFRGADGLSGDFVHCIFEDREGDVWVATNDGLDRFRDVVVPTISRNEGLLHSEAWSVDATPDGSIWIATADGLNRWENGHVTVYRARTSPSQNSQRDDREISTNGQVSEVPNSGLTGNAQSLGQDDRGRLWASTTDGVFYFERSQFVRVPGVPGGVTFSIKGDGHGNVWISNYHQGLFFWTEGSQVQRIPWPRFGQKPGMDLLPDPRGGLWLGFDEGGVAYIQDGQVRASYNTADGLGNGTVSLRLGRHGELWSGTEGGLSRIEDGRVTTLTSKNGLPCDAVHWSIEDDDNATWLYMPCGLVRIARSELDAWVSDEKHVVQTTVFDISDGVRTFGIPSGYLPHVTKSPDGKIWFTPRDGVSVVDPRHLAFNKLSPPVHIEQIVADRKSLWQRLSGGASSSSPDVPPLVRDLEIDYTALSLVAPEKVRFRVKLEGWDRDWKDAGNERKAFYSNLPPRHYRFRVIACNNSGVWNEAGDSLDFDIPPAWYQTMGFRALCVAAFMALLWAVYRLRVHQLQEQEKKFRDAVETMPALAFAVDSNGKRTFLNRGWLEYTGLSSDLASGSGWERAVHPDDLNRLLERWRTSQATGQHLDYEVRLRRGSDGAYRWFQMRARPLRDRRGKIVKWCAVANDIEDRKQAERLQADLTHANRVSTMGELVASISHELAQPITVTAAHARASVRWLQHDPPNLTEALKGSEKVVEAGAMAAEIIDRLRSLYKKEPPKRESVAINAVITDMAGMLRSEARGHGVSIRTDLKEDLPLTLADRVQVQQVLMNLMLNGIEAMSETGGVLTVKSQMREEGQIQISVNDTGPGLPHGKTDQIFDAFFTTKPQGSGMGLAICKSIVESHGGRIWANGNGGRGATFHFTLPAGPAEPTPPVTEGDFDA